MQDPIMHVRCGRDNLDFFAATLLSTRRRIMVHNPVELRDTFQALALEAMQAAANPSA